MIDRIIPTRVGTSFTQDTRRPAYKDHPHACGDKQYRPLPTMRFLGSSPRVWGQAWAHGLKTATDRIIPTRVGTRSALHLYLRFPRDHPHACGDKTVVNTTLIRF